MRSPLIIGGGPAGAAAAVLISAAGHPVTLVERNAGPADKVCGDFLSGGALSALAALGVDPLALGAAPITAVRFVHRDRVAEAALPFPAAGLSRRVLDEALLRRAAGHGATIVRGQAVRGLQHDASGFRARTASAGEQRADTVFIATGKHDLRGHARPPRDADLLGLKMYYGLAPDQQAALHGRIELHLLRGGYAGLQLVEQDRAVLCVLLPAARYRRVDADWAALLDDIAAESPLLARRLAGATACLAQPLAIAGTPYGHLHRPAHAEPPGLFRLGDQACVVPSLVGDGVAIALHSARRAAAVWLSRGSAADYHAGLARRAALPLRFAALVHAACCSAGTQALVAAACRAWPPALGMAAALSRVAPLA
jgi:menaquinone-9 beta-reductase